MSIILRSIIQQNVREVAGQLRMSYIAPTILGPVTIDFLKYLPNVSLQCEAPNDIASQQQVCRIHYLIFVPLICSTISASQ